MDQDSTESQISPNSLTDIAHINKTNGMLDTMVVEKCCHYLKNAGALSTRRRRMCHLLNTELKYISRLPRAIKRRGYYPEILETTRPRLKETQVIP